MDLFPSQVPQETVGHVQSAEDRVVIQDGTATQGGMEPALADVTGAQREAVHEQRDALSESMDAFITPKNHEIVIVEIEEITAGEFISPLSHRHFAGRWLFAVSVFAVVLVGAGWLTWQRWQDEA
jgi:hypothetical protein